MLINSTVLTFAYFLGFRGFRHGIARSSKEVTFDKIRREINDRGHQLRFVVEMFAAVVVSRGWTDREERKQF